MDKIIFFSPVTEFFILVFVLGLGLSISNIFFKNEEIKDNLDEIALIGFCLTLPISQIINFFIPITQMVFLILSIFSFSIIFYKFRYLKNYKKWLLKLLLIFIIFIPFKYVIKGNEDLFYHLPKVEFISEYKIIFGIAHVNPSLAFTNGWANISGLFNIFNGASKNLYLVSYVFYVLCLLTIYNFFKKTKINSVKYIALIIFFFSIVKFNRLQEFGNDIQSMLLIFITFILYVRYFNDDEDKKKLINQILFYSFFAFLFRIYAVFIAPLFLLFLYKRDNIFKYISKKLILIFVISFLSTSLTSFANSGCFFMPIEKTCIKKNYFNSSYQSKMSGLTLHLKSFNKSFNDYDKSSNLKLSREEWIKSFNWLTFHVSSKRFLEPLIKTISILTLIILLFLFKKKLVFKKNENIIISILAFFSTLLWLIFTPIFRAGGYTYVVIFFLITIFSVFHIDKKIYFKDFKIIASICCFFLLTINVNRILKEGKKYKTFSPFFFEKWHELNPAYYQSYLDLKKILNTDNSFSEIGSLKVYKKNKFWFISEK